MSWTFIRFLLVGVVNTAVGMSLSFILLHAAKWNYWGATIGGNGIGAVSSYMLNRRFTFRSDAAVTRSFFRFLVVISFCYVTAYLIGRQLGSFISVSSVIPAPFANDVSIVLGSGCYTLLNFFGQKRFVFQK